MAEEHTIVLNVKRVINIDYLLLVNKDNPLDPNFEITNLVEVKTRIAGAVEIDRKIFLETKTYEAWMELKKAALKNGYDFDIDSGHRTFDYQQKVMNYYITRIGLDAALLKVALPGTSEHQTGLALDYSYFRNEECILNVKETDEEYIWIKNNAHKYGFVIRYPKEKEDVTKYTFEPWHLRYVGRDHANKMYNEFLVLEEYILKLEEEKNVKIKKKR